MVGKGKVKVFIPRTRKDEPDVYVCVNGKSIQIKRGVEVEVDPKYAEVLKHSQKADKIALEHMAELEAKTAEKKI